MIHSPCRFLHFSLTLLLALLKINTFFNSFLLKHSILMILLSFIISEFVCSFLQQFSLMLLCKKMFFQTILFGLFFVFSFFHMGLLHDRKFMKHYEFGYFRNMSFLLRKVLILSFYHCFLVVRLLSISMSSDF